MTDRARPEPGFGAGEHRPRPNSYRDLSHWMSTVDDELAPRAALDGDLDVDVAIAGGGYTGLWTAYYLAKADPAKRIAVLEAQICGFGASGRNGGWCSALFPKSVSALARRYGRDRAIALHRAMQTTVDEVGRVAAAEGIDCHFAKGGTIVVARTEAQLSRAREEIAEAREYGFGPEDVDLLGAGEARAHLGATQVRGGTYTPHCAAIHPARLARGLARVVAGLGVRVYERTPALDLRPGMVRTAHGTVRAGVVLRATEAYTARLPGLRRAIAPVYSLVVATQPLPAAVWDEIGLARRETFSDHRHVIIYGQRTADDRLVFGGRGAPYHFGSRIRPGYDREPKVFAELSRVLVELFPVLGPKPPIAHRWGGPLGIPRDWCASVGLADGLAWAGGYVGDGVATTNLAGRTVTDLILGRETELTGLPWVGHRSPRWEPEPLRWLGANATLKAMALGDAAEARRGRPSRTAAIIGRLIGD